MPRSFSICRYASNRNLAERDDDAHAAAARRLRRRGAADNWRSPRGVGLLSGRRAAHRRGDERVAQLRGRRRIARGRDVGEARAMERRHQEIARAAGAVAGEDAAGAVGAVRRRRQPDDEQPRAGDRRIPAPAAPSRCRRRNARRFSTPIRSQYSRRRVQRWQVTIVSRTVTRLRFILGSRLQWEIPTGGARIGRHCS